MPASTTNVPLSEKAQKYLAHGEVKTILDQLRSREYPVSDLRCKDPERDRYLYFVDLVQQGGGVLGVALVGYTYALEEAGIRFVSMAGTSAGAINTLLLAGCGKPEDAKSHIILNEMCAKEFSDFVDPGWRVLWPIKGVLQKNILVKVLSGLALFVLNLWGILFKKGLCSGNAFEKWVKDVMKRHSISSIDTLLDRMNTLPGNLEIRKGGEFRRAKPEDGINASIAIISADITTQTKVEFPRIAHLYVPEKKEKPSAPGKYTHLDLYPEQIVRASMAIPVFFRPKYFQPPEKGKTKVQDWIDHAAYLGPVPDQVLMVDGGVMSNFPIDVFHQVDRTPQRPTFGVRLGLSRTKSSDIEGVLSLLGASFNGARNLRDFEFLFKNEDYKNLVQYIDTDKYDWLNFGISEGEKMELFELGVKAARDFLEGSAEKEAKAFDWSEYRALRRRMLFSSSTERTESLWTKEDAIRKLGLEKKQIPPADRNTERSALAPAPDFVQAFHDNLATVEAYLRTGKRIAVLWVDDDPANDFFELSVLRSFGLDFLTALTDEDAYDKLRTNADIKLVITDSNRQGYYKRGLEFCKHLNAMGILKPILLHSISQAKDYEKTGEQGKHAFEEDIKKKYSPLIVGNFVDARELVFATVREIAKVVGPA